MYIARIFFFISSVVHFGVAFAQYGTPASLKAELKDGGDLVFGSIPKDQLGTSSELGNQVFAPPRKTDEKHPALVIFHTCGGISQHVRDWAEEALKAGYVVLVPDAMRGLSSDCGSPPQIPNARMVKDALDAVAHLASLPFVDSSKISIMGFSKGAFMATWAASNGVTEALRPGTPPIAAAIAIYGLCGLEPTRGRPQGAVVLQPDTTRPLLMLLGGQDNETPPKMCLDMLPKLRDAGAPVQWHLYPDATHCWDCSEKNGFSKTAYNGQRVTYIFDKAATEDARRRAFSFLSTIGK
jgi:dienelactone hydrolase